MVSLRPISVAYVPVSINRGCVHRVGNRCYRTAESCGQSVERGQASEVGGTLLTPIRLHDRFHTCVKSFDQEGPHTLVNVDVPVGEHLFPIGPSCTP